MLQPSLGLFEAVTNFRKAVKHAVTDGKNDQAFKYDVDVRDITTSMGVPINTERAIELLAGGALFCV